MRDGVGILLRPEAVSLYAHGGCCVQLHAQCGFASRRLRAMAFHAEAPRSAEAQRTLKRRGANNGSMLT